MTLNKTWPVLKRYEGGFLRKIALPLGGIGTGTVSLGGRGNLFDWEIVNRPAKGFTPEHCFFAIFAKEAGKEPVTRVIEGVIPVEDYDGAAGSCGVPNHGLPRFRKCSFAAAYPFGQVSLSDPDVPVDVRIEAFNPLTPPDADKSGIPAAVIRFVLENKTQSTVTASVCGNLKNFIGMDGSAGGPKQNVNIFKTGDHVRGLLLKSDGVAKTAEQWGTMALTVVNTGGVTHRTSWKNYGWSVPVLDFWDDFSSDGKLEDRPLDGQDSPVASLATQLRIPARAIRTVTFVITWHFPNRQTWTPQKVAEGSSCCCDGDPNRIGNYYTTQYDDAWDVAIRTAAALPALEVETVRFSGSVCGSDLPEVVKDAALSNLCNLRTQTCFRTADGRFYAWEGCGDKNGCCHGSCTHVWNYESATAFLFGGLARSMRDIEFTEAMHDNGMMSFRINLPLE
ncbi:MAG: GH116 family glycosyl-hydrolase, partial [bacterium]